MKKILPPWRGLTAQLLAITVLPLTLLLLLIAFGSVSLHQQDMRALVGERDERAIQSAASALASELHHRAASITNLTALAEHSDDISSILMTDDLASDFEGGLAYLDKDGQRIARQIHLDFGICYCNRPPPSPAIPPILPRFLIQTQTTCHHLQFSLLGTLWQVQPPELPHARR
jgi:hypothetical protein